MRKQQENWSIKWHTAWYSSVLTFFIFITVITVILLHYQLKIDILLALGWAILPILAMLVFSSMIGFLYGTRIVHRLSPVKEALVQLERGNFQYRIKSIGSDEIGNMAIQINQMAHRVEQQVASLQKLSTERTEWQTQMKQEVVSEERGRLARELHDTISQQLFAISMMSSAISAMNLQDTKEVAKKVGFIEKLAGEAQQEMRALLMHLRPVTLEGKDLKTGLEDLLEELQEKQSLQATWELEDIPTLARGIEDHLFRIVQEALSNVLRHAKAKKVHIRLVVRGKYLHLKIIDDGIGFDESKMKMSSYGLKSISERASEIGGIGEVLSLPGRGTHINVKVPIL
ncbi:sensor histidine kinase [Shimazuella sp. AN120528]|uniref:HAMP domain-containing sensor histidine kinase n=1 Tax=Shimazuella soli TaxID=1892854 RepID=UPI001F0F12EB|nr:sensor histidine kinase [Shimazuella soli]MCH5585012.1 sensor histidine kinase [Shimazuella soli]